jgi:DNA replication factor GINS
MNLEELRTVRRTERQKDTLQHLRDSFYRDAAEYIENLKRQRKEAADRSDNPFGDPEVGRLTDEIETAEEVVESLYERRVGKVVKLATFAAADMGGDEGGLTDEERDLYDDLVARIRENREVVLDTLANAHGSGESDTASDASPSQESPEEVPPDTPDPVADASADDLLAEAMGTDDDAEQADATATDDAVEAAAPTPDGGDETAATTETGAESEAGGGSDTADEPPTADRTTVRITRDVGEIFGVDQRSYDLEREDVVTLPADNAEPLLQKNAAERLD